MEPGRDLSAAWGAVAAYALIVCGGTPVTPVPTPRDGAGPAFRVVPGPVSRRAHTVHRGHVPEHDMISALVRARRADM
ncbi:hypothetical protein CKY47_09350 [Saccharothrix yanglingensis]|uniref:Uncharacterized protein n=1 Tax=Saccharothrix yanglingensis TaxID=659496 RepID=A0ABU0WWE5_9PSEU|nr:hypothetical protein [Saccharothrix yanglingensis]